MLFKLFGKKKSNACADVGYIVCVSLGYNVGGGFSI